MSDDEVLEGHDGGDELLPSKSRLARLSKFEPAPGIDSLDQARRLITHLMQPIERLHKEMQPGPGEYTIRLRPEYDEMFQDLFEDQTLFRNQFFWDDDPLKEWAMNTFVELRIGAVWAQRYGRISERKKRKKQ